MELVKGINKTGRGFLQKAVGYLTQKGYQEVIDTPKEYNKKIKAGLYIRISTGEQSNFSLEGQKGELLKYCKENGLDYFKIYQDQLSGLEFEKREGLQKALDDGEKSLYDILLVTEMDRLARDTNIIGYIKLTLQMKGISIRAINEPEAKTEYDELIQGVINLFSNFEAKRRKRRCIRGISKAREVGKIINRVPYGYRFINKGSKQSKVIIDTEKSQIVKDIFNRYANKESIYKIAKEVMMARSTIRYILKNKFYWDNKLYGEHEAIINK